MNTLIGHEYFIWWGFNTAVGIAAFLFWYWLRGTFSIFQENLKTVREDLKSLSTNCSNRVKDCGILFQPKPDTEKYQKQLDDALREIQTKLEYIKKEIATHAEVARATYQTITESEKDWKFTEESIRGVASSVVELKRDLKDQSLTYRTKLEAEKDWKYLHEKLQEINNNVGELKKELKEGWDAINKHSHSSEGRVVR